MTTNLERLQQQAQAGAEVQPEVQPFDYLYAVRIVRQANPGLDGQALTGAVEQVKVLYLATGAYTAQQATFQVERFKMHQRHKEEARELARQHGRKAQWLSQRDTDQCIREGLDDIAQGRAPSGTRYLRNRGKGAEYVNKVRSLRNDSQNAKALQSLSEHTVMRVINESALEVSAMYRGTLSGCLKNVAAHYINAEKLTEQVRREVAKATASLISEQAATNKRLEIVEAGEHWHDVARRMRSEGRGPSAIAQATGQKLNTVKVYLKRQNKGCE